MKLYLMLAWRLVKVLPFIGCVFVLGNAPNVLRRKGYVLGAVEIILDLLPVVCLLKAAIEAATGADLIPEKVEAASPQFEAVAQV